MTSKMHDRPILSEEALHRLTLIRRLPAKTPQAVCAVKDPVDQMM